MDIFFPPLNTEGAMPIKSRSINHFLTHLQSNTPLTSVEYTYSNKCKMSDAYWREWMDENPNEANNQLEDGHPIITRLIVADSEEGKKD